MEQSQAVFIDPANILHVLAADVTHRSTALFRVVCSPRLGDPGGLEPSYVNVPISLRSAFSATAALFDPPYLREPGGVGTRLITRTPSTPSSMRRIFR